MDGRYSQLSMESVPASQTSSTAKLEKSLLKLLEKKKELNLMRVAGVFAPAWGEKLLKVFAGSWQTAQPVEGLAAKPDFLSSIPRTGMVEGARSKS